MGAVDQSQIDLRVWWRVPDGMTQTPTPSSFTAAIRVQLLIAWRCWAFRGLCWC
jgi:hypothetical protein